MTGILKPGELILMIRTLEDYNAFKRDKANRKGGRVFSNQCLEILLKDVRIKGEIKTEVDVYYSPSGQAENTDEDFMHQKTTVSKEAGIVIMGGGGVSTTLTSAENLTVPRVGGPTHACPSLLTRHIGVQIPNSQPVLAL